MQPRHRHKGISQKSHYGELNQPCLKRYACFGGALRLVLLGRVCVFAYPLAAWLVSLLNVGVFHGCAPISEATTRATLANASNAVRK